MQRNLLIEAKKHIQSNRRHRVWQKFVRVMAGCVVFCTTYALILPAITMEQEAFCGYEEHTHSDECYVRTSPSLKLTCSPDELELHVHSERCLDANGNTVCGLTDYVAHTHTADCFDENGLVVCAFPEIGQHVHDSSCYSVPETTAQSHTHSDSCYSKEKGELICTTVQQEAHTHTDACYAAEKALVCTTAESAGHVHSDSCYTTENVLTCTTAESAGHTHAAECYDAEGALICTAGESAGHAHGDGCYTAQKNLTCGQAEQEAHTHGDSCYETPIVCGLIETEGHAHTDACYAWNETVICGLEETPIPEPELICTAPIAEAHVHSADCFETIEEPLTCQLEESEEHTHTDLCYGTWKLACPKEEHTHELICFSDPEADLETAQVWEKTFKDVELTGVWADDVLAIAKTQIGYAESTRNYEVWEDGTTHGYTRYGDWFGSPYGDWCAMFVSFCIHYAEIDGVPLNWGCRTWIEELSKDGLDLYREAGEYDPKPGDIIFFDWEDENGDSDDLADHVGLVAELIPATGTEPAKIKTIEGNSSSQVKYNKYDADDTEILGYGIMPENPELEAEEETVTALYTYSDDNVYVEVQLPEDTTVPADAVLTVTPIASDDEGYDDYVAQAEEAVDGTVANIALYDISFYTADGTYYPVDDTAKVTMGFVESPVDTAANVQVLHFAEEDAVPEVIKNVTVEEKEIEMTLDGVQKADIPATAALEQQPMASLFSRAMPAAPAETEPEVQTLTETRTIVEFETPGFSTFAVVQVQTGTYVANVLRAAELNDQLNNLGGRIFVISPGFGYEAENGVHYAVTSEDVTIHKYNNQGYHEYERLKAGEVQYDSATLTTPADDGFLWKFIKVDGKNNTYYIQSVETGQYLYMGPGEAVKTTGTPNEIIVTYRGNEGDNGRVSLRSESNYYLKCVGINIEQIKEDVRVFTTDNSDGWGEMFLAEYTGETSSEAPSQWPLDGQKLVISRQMTDNDSVAVLTKDNKNNIYEQNGEQTTVQILRAVEKSATTDASGNIVSVFLDSGDLNTAVWEFTAVAGKPNTYNIRLVDGGYLHLHDDRALTVESAPQDIELYPTNYGNTVAFRIPNPADNNNPYYVHWFGDWDFGTWAGYGDNARLVLTDYIDRSTELDGKEFVISWLNGDKTQAAVMTSDMTTDLTAETYVRNVLRAAEKSVTTDTNGKLSYVNLGNDVNKSIWKFTAVAGKPDTYNIQVASADPALYLVLNDRNDSDIANNRVESDLTLSNTPQEIKVTYNDDNTVILSASVNEVTRYVNYLGEDPNRGFGCWNSGTPLSLYIDEESLLGTNGGQFVISIPISGTNTASVMTGVETTDPQNGTSLVLGGIEKPTDAYGNVVNVSEIGKSAVWNFIPVENETNVYYIQSVATGEYLTIPKNGNALTTGTTAQGIEVVSLGNRIALKLPGESNQYVHWQNFNGDVNRGFATWPELQDGETYLTLTKYTPEQNHGELVTNLADKVGILCAVDNTGEDWGNSAIVTDIKADEGAFENDRVGLKTVQTTAANVDPDGQAYNTVELDDYSNMIWKIIGTNAAGEYYIQSQDSGKYLHLDATGATLSDEPQTLEIVRAATDWWPNAFWVRVPLNGTNYYLNLHGNKSANSVSTYAFPISDTPTDTSSNFVFAELSEEEMAAIMAVIGAIDDLPNQEALVQAVRNLVNARDVNGAQTLQNSTVTAASAAIMAYDALTDEQKLFVGIDRINKLEELREWLVAPSDITVDETGTTEDGNGTTEDGNGTTEDGNGTTEDGNGTTEDKKLTGRLPNVVQSDPASGVKVNVFNYPSTITNDALHTNGFTFFNDNGNGVDGGAQKTGYVDVLDPNKVTFKLNGNGYPVLVDNDKGTEIDLSNLFNGTYEHYTMTDGGGLFRQDENGYYFYYSDMNAAYFNGKEFTLYDTVVRPYSVWWTYDNANPPSATYENDLRSNFIPFNTLINPDVTSNIVYDGEDHQNANPKDIAESHDLELNDEPEQVPTAIINDVTDLWFGMNMEFDFLMPEDGKLNGQPMTFDFHGDDDVWVFIDDALVLDLGGTHEAWDGNINFATGAVYSHGTGSTTLKAQFIKVANAYENDGITYNQETDTVEVNGKTIAFNGDTLADYTAHNLKFFYLERGGFISYCGIKFNMPTLPKNSLIVNKVASSPADQDKDFQFRVVEANSKGEPKYNDDESVTVFLGQGTEFTIKEDGKDDQTGTVGEGGIFTLKPGQSAVFTDVNAGQTEGKELVVQEILGSGHAYNVSYLLSSEGVIKPVDKDDEITNTDSSNYSSSSFSSTDDHEIVTFYNEPEGSGQLSITKKMADETTSDATFYVRVRMGQKSADTLIPVGTKYHINGATLTVEKAGIIPLKAGETATIIGITPGLHYEVAEYLTGSQNYKPTYTVNETNNEGTQRANNDYAKIIGIVQANETVAITITNDSYEHSVKLPITKEVLPAGVPDNFYFLVDQVNSLTDLSPVKEYRPGMMVRVDAEGKSDANIMIGIDSSESDPGPWYFKVYEENTTSNYYYDSNFYVVEVVLEDNKAIINQVLKNGTGNPISTDGGLPFVNRKFTELTVTKTVVGSTGGTFNFNVNVTVGEDKISYPVDNISLTNNGSKTYQIPYGANVTVTETNSDGYYTSYEVYSRYEAEDGELSNGAEATNNQDASGGKDVRNIVPDNGIESVKLFPNMLSSGSYSMRLQYNTVVERSFRVTVNNDSQIDVKCNPYGTEWYSDWTSVGANVSLNQGTNTISIRGTTGTGAYAPNLDYVDIVLKTGAGTSATQNGITDPVTIHFTNTVGYELPMSGGTGTYLYTLGGLLLTMAAILMYNLINKRRKEELASS